MFEIKKEYILKKLEDTIKDFEFFKEVYQNNFKEKVPYKIIKIKKEEK